MTTLECLEWRTVERGSLRGFAKIKVPEWKLTIDDVAVHESSGKRWAALPARPILDGSRGIAKDENGKARYAKTLWFDDRETSDRFSEAVLQAVEAHRAKKPADGSTAGAAF